MKRKSEMMMNKRPVEKKFIEAMEEGLEHGRKMGRTGWDTHWKETKFESAKAGLLDKLDEEYQELVEAVEDGESFQTILKEAGDVANIAMMLADITAADPHWTNTSAAHSLTS